MTTSTNFPVQLAGYAPVFSDDIIYFRADINYSWLYLTSGQKHLTAITLLSFENQLPDFLRISRRYLVNPSHIVDYQLVCHRHLYVILSNGAQFLVSRRKTRQILDYLQHQPMTVH